MPRLGKNAEGGRGKKNFKKRSIAAYSGRKGIARQSNLTNIGDLKDRKAWRKETETGGRGEFLRINHFQSKTQEIRKRSGYRAKIITRPGKGRGRCPTGKKARGIAEDSRLSSSSILADQG